MSMNARFSALAPEANTVAIRMQADEGMAAGDVVRNVAGNSGHVEKASNEEGNAIGVAQNFASTGSFTEVVRSGVIRVNFVSAPSAAHNGNRVFLSSTDGKCQANSPTESGTSIIQIGYLLGGDGSTTSPRVFVDIRIIAHNS